MPSGTPVVNLQKILHPSPLQVIEDTPLGTIYELFSRMGVRHVIVVRDGSVVGIISKRDVHKWLMWHQARLNQEVPEMQEEAETHEAMRQLAAEGTPTRGRRGSLRAALVGSPASPNSPRRDLHTP
jgi:predicted transcriptional regulator